MIKPCNMVENRNIMKFPRGEGLVTELSELLYASFDRPRFDTQSQGDDASSTVIVKLLLGSQYLGQI